MVCGSFLICSDNSKNQNSQRPPLVRQNGRISFSLEEEQAIREAIEHTNNYCAAMQHRTGGRRGSDVSHSSQVVDAGQKKPLVEDENDK